MKVLWWLLGGWIQPAMILQNYLRTIIAWADFEAFSLQGKHSLTNPEHYSTPEFQTGNSKRLTPLLSPVIFSSRW